MTAYSTLPFIAHNKLFIVGDVQENDQNSNDKMQSVKALSTQECL